MNIDRINELRAFYAKQQKPMAWTTYDYEAGDVEGVCAGYVLTKMIPELRGAAITPQFIAQALEIPYESAYALFWLKEPGGKDYMVNFNGWHINQQRNFLEAALRGLIETGELHLDPVEWPA